MTQPYEDKPTAEIARTLAMVSSETARVLAQLTAETNRGLAQTISGMQTTLALLKQSVDVLTDEVRHTNGDHEERIRKLEDSDRKWATIAIGASVIVTAAIKLMWP